MKKVSNLPNHFATIEDLSLYRWDRYTSTKDNNWFLVDYDGRQKKTNMTELLDVEKSIQDQYFKAIDDKSFFNKIQKWSKIDWLKTKYSTCNFLLDELSITISLELDIEAKKYLTYLTERRHHIILELKKWGLKFPPLNSLVSDLSLINDFRSVLKGISTEIAIIGNELKDDGQKDTKSLYARIVIAKSSLAGYEMNPKTMSLAEWIEICKVLNEKAKQN
jgi:hypothetical protein